MMMMLCLCLQLGPIVRAGCPVLVLHPASVLVHALLFSGSVQQAPSCGASNPPRPLSFLYGVQVFPSFFFLHPSSYTQWTLSRRGWRLIFLIPLILLALVGVCFLGVCEDTSSLFPCFACHFPKGSPPPSATSYPLLPSACRLHSRVAHPVAVPSHLQSHWHRQLAHPAGSVAAADTPLLVV